MEPVLLMIFDGFGVNPSRADNGWARAQTPHLDHYFASWPHAVLEASGPAVGLPEGQFGNSEVGHMTLGAGRVLEQDLERITHAVTTGDIATHPAWSILTAGKARVHLIGMVSDGGVHSHIDHLLALLPLLVTADVEPIIHMITDGRDTPPRSAGRYLAQVQERLGTLGRGRVATVSGRYYAMDRAGNWDRTEIAWRAIVNGEGRRAATPEDALAQAYAGQETDEFIVPTVIEDPGAPLIGADECVLDFNFRSDRARQLVAAIGLADFSSFERKPAGARTIVCMTEYDVRFPFPVMFPAVVPRRVLGEVLSEAGIRQFHCAETEKYPHVTYFFNGGREQPFAGEDRAIVPSPAVATYDLKPEMSAAGVADRVIAAIGSREYPFILVNFANADMVGHTAVVDAIIEAVQTLDLQSHRVIQAALDQGYKVLLTADHGNCDEMVDPLTGEPHTRHTAYPVPLLLVGKRVALRASGGELADVAPTVLDIMGIQKPPEMQGHSLIVGKT